MLEGLNINGNLVTAPGVYAQADYSATASAGDVFKTLAVVGRFPFLPKATAVTATSQRSLEMLAPRDPELRKVAKLIFAASGDDRIGGRPGTVVLSSVVPTTLATQTNNACIKFSATQWGYAGNQTKYNLFNKTGKILSFDGSEDDEGVFTVTRGGQSEAFNFRCRTIFNARRTAATGSWTSTKYRFDGTEFIVYGEWTDNNGIIALANLSDLCAGPIRVVLSAAPGDGKSRTFQFKGKKMDGVTDADETITISGTQTIGTTSESYSLITDITGAAENTPDPATAAIQGTLGASTTANTAADLINDLKAMTAVTVDEVYALADSIPISELGGRTEGAAFEPAAVVFHDGLRALKEAVAGSSLVTASVIDWGLIPTKSNNATTFTSLTGGSEGFPALADWEAALTATYNATVPVTHIALLSSDLAIQQAARTHAVDATSRRSQIRHIWTGAPANKTIDELNELTAAVKSRHIRVTAQKVRTANADGQLEWFDPEYFALMLASMECSVPVGYPLVWKTPNIVDFSQNTEWDPINDAEALNLNAQVVVVTKRPTGIRLERVLTTFRSSVDPARQEASADESCNFSVYGVQNALTIVIGEPSVATAEARIRSIVLTELRAQLLNNWIQAYDPKSLTVTQSGTKWIVGYAMIPVYPINQVGLFPRVMISFEINQPVVLAA